MVADYSDRTCCFCGQHFLIRTSRLKYGCGKFCSPGCKRNSEKRQISLLCQVCGTAYSVPQSHSHGSRFCSKACARNGITNTPIAVRFWRYVSSGDRDECWEWNGSLNKSGYGQIMGEKGNRRPRLAHVISWEIHNNCKTKLCILHSCDNPKCVNPHHLREGTQIENIADTVARDRTCRGERRKTAKLSDNIVRTIRAMYSSGTPICELAQRCNVAIQTIRDAVARRTWKHVV